MAVRSESGLGLRLNWVSVPYRNVYLVGGGLTLLLLLAVTTFGMRETIADLLSAARREARVEIAAAERLVEQASGYAQKGRTASIQRSAIGKLEEARALYGRRDYRDARTSAIVAQNYAQKVIDMGRGESATSREVRFYKIEGEVRVKRAGQFHWEDATPRLLLHIGDQIKTGSRSGAQIIYFDGAITTIRPESLLEIKDLYEEPSTRKRRVKEKLNWGEVETSTRRANVSGSFHEIESEAANTRTSEESSFSVAYDKTQRTGKVTLWEGRADVATPDRQVAMASGETVSIARGVMGEVEKLPPAPRLLVPADQKIFVFRSPEAASMTLAWEKDGATARYRLQLSESSLFGSLILDKPDVRSSTVEVPGLPPSTYFWRVAAVDGRGRTSPFSASRRFRIATSSVRDRGDTTPPALVLQDYVQNGPYVIVNGRTEPDATLWVDGERIDVDEAGGFYAVMRLRREGRNEIVVMAQDAAGNESRKALEAYLDEY